jgi:hypothetical protein
LPAPVSALSLGGDASALASIPAAGLRVATVAPRGQRDLPFAHHAVRFGPRRAFFLDDHAYAETAGFWTVGEASTTVEIDTDAGTAGTPTLRLQSGPVATTVKLTVDEWSRIVTLGPHAGEAVTLPPSAGGRTTILSIETGAMFLPVQHDPRSRDFRHLGVWVEIQ